MELGKPAGGCWFCENPDKSFCFSVFVISFGCGVLLVTDLVIDFCALI